MESDAIDLCASGDLVDSALAVPFDVVYQGQTCRAFAIRYQGQVHAYLNRCSHVPMELDWRPGVFFATDGRDLICSTHGAEYAADSGRCLGGPCGETPLIKLTVAEREGSVYFLGFEDD